ncbi:threonine ammonia-lyase IlvA [Allosediminivita pacifica]|uniref:L-threonine dehydratase n=1 Tax=Allosediminivita pacifica TaxID=1267769 RepID=A0A2T6B5T2_9RHOB|nr:threonine ammonia-lyase IlvA [Allosediminivita pacifica]PTX51436.1 L-threonine ammonia-lyase [Allosediminivita pacifica]GGA99823.1 L-threonine dehydratase [Allosediminivita pacifica]
MSDFADKARAAEAALRDVFPPTPLQRNAYLSEKTGADVWLKREDLAPVRSYKLRGAFNAMRKRPEAELIVAASAGNHAQGVAYMCAQFGKRGVIFMPVTTPQQKIQKTRAFGGDAIEIRLTGDYFDDCLHAAQSYCAEEGGVFLSPFDNPDVIEGQASVAVEIEAQLGGAPDHMVIPVGGGGLASGCLGYFGTACQYSLVEPAGGASLRAALAAGHPVTLPKVDTFADGAAVARIGAAPFEILKDVGLASTLTVDEDRLCITMLDLLNVEGIVLEPAGALSIDALGDLGQVIRGKRVVCVTSGGNFDFERLPEVKERAQRYAGLKKYFILRLPQRPGALKTFLELLGPDDDIARFEYLKKSARNFGSVLIGIETSDPNNFERFFARLDANGYLYEDITRNEVLSQFLV